MKHLSEEELVEYYYREGNRIAAERHLRECAECATAYETLRRDLSELKAEPVPEHGAGYGESVWRAIRNSLPVYQKKQTAWWRNWATLKYAGMLAVLVVAAFLAGRYWPSSHRQIAGNDANARERLMLVVLGDHLERSERLLVELKHAGGVAAGSPIQSEAKELLTENRLYRETASQLNDPALSSSLDHLERLLVEIANDPNGLSEADTDRLQKEMNSDGLLFEIRVLRTRVMIHEPQSVNKPKGASI